MQPTADAVRGLDVGRLGQGLLVAVVPDGHVGARLGEGVGDGEADAGAGARDDGGAALEREEGQHAVAGGDARVVADKGAVLDLLHLHGLRLGCCCEAGAALMMPGAVVIRGAVSDYGCVMPWE